jgi:hypothetical protein
MFILNSTLLREKFILRENPDDPKPMVATGNRIALPLISNTGAKEERLIVRGQNMHTTLRMAAMICKTYFREGPIQSRSPSYSWGPNWDINLPEYERENNPNLWVAVYSGGKPVFKRGEYHPFLNIIEQCDARNRDEYDRALSIAENAFNVAGRGISIAHDTKIAMVIGAMLEKTRVGLILRNPDHTSTFNFGVDTKINTTTKDKAIAEPYQTLLYAANWLELIQLSVNTGFLRARRNIRNKGATLEQTLLRIDKINSEMAQFEETFEVSFRPERPNIVNIVKQAVDFSRNGA